MSKIIYLVLSIAILFGVLILLLRIPVAAYEDMEETRNPATTCYTEKCNPYSIYQDPYSIYQDPYSIYQDPYSEYQNPYSVDKYIPNCKLTGAC